MAPFPPDPRTGVSDHPWFKLGRMLPGRLRDRVFEPAYFDLLSESRRRKRSNARLGFLVFGLAFEAFRVGVPGLLLSSRRARRNVSLLALLTVLLIALAAYTKAQYQYSRTVPYTPAATAIR